MSGKSTFTQDVEATRQNHPDTIAAFGEFTDNSVSWGNSDKGSIIIDEDSITVIDNGKFKRERFPFSFCKRKSKETNGHYNITNNELGRYNFGLTDGVILFGNLAELFHRFDENTYMKTIFNVTECKKKDDIISNEICMTPSEIDDFKNKQVRNDTDYDIINGRGTILKISNLLKSNKLSSL